MDPPKRTATVLSACVFGVMLLLGPVDAAIANCGDAVVEAGEQCDDGNTAEGDCCSPSCEYEPAASLCEADGDHCTTDQCDDVGNCTFAVNVVCPEDGNVCNGLETCEPSTGDCFSTQALVCDDGNPCNGTETCDPALGCQIGVPPTICGDGYVCGAESCDDGDQTDGDGCDSNCTPTGCGNGIVTAPEACDDGDQIDGNGCDSNCTPTSCGNGVVTASEGCDDGNQVDGDGCDSNCTLTDCGNLVVSGAEQCDDGNQTSCDGCSSLCRTEPVGASWCFAGGPVGGPVTAIAIDPTSTGTLYAGIQGGVLKTADGGQTWIPMEDGIRGTWVRALAVSPVESGIVLALTAFGAPITPPGIFRSSNGGGNWSRVHPSSASLSSIVFDPSNSAIVWAAAETGGLFKSTDAGVTWSNVPGVSSPCAIAIDPNNSAVVYVGTVSHEVLKTTDGGTTWAAADNGLVGSPYYCTLLVHPADSQRVFVGGQTAVYRSIDGGGSWQAVDLFGSGSLALDPANPAVLYSGHSGFGTGLGIRKSEDGGDSWHDVFTVNDVYWNIVVDASTTPSTVYAATNTGILRSVDEGATWQPMNNGVHGATIMAMTQDAADDVYVATDHAGVWIGRDGGATWLDASGDLPVRMSNRAVTGLTVDPTAPSTMYAGVLNQGIFKTTNGGQSWARADSGIVDPGNFASRIRLAIDPAEPQIVYATTWNGGVFRTADGAASWTRLAVGEPTPLVPVAIELDPVDSRIVYVGAIGSADGPIRKSEDGGATWAAHDLTADPQADEFVMDFAVDPTTQSTVYAATGSGVYKSTDGGSTWSHKVAGISGARSISAVVVDPLTPSTVYAAAPFVGLYVSSDGAESWTLQPDPLLTNLSITALAVAAGAPTLGRMGPFIVSDEAFLWAGTGNTGGASGVFRRGLGGDVGMTTTTLSAATTTTTLLATTTTTTVPPTGAPEPILGRSLVLRQGRDVSHRRLIALSRDPRIGLGNGNGTSDDPVETGGSQLRVITSAGCSGPCDDTYPMTAGWSYIGQRGENKGYRYRGVTGTVRTVIVKPGRRAKVVARGALGHSLSFDPQPIDVILTVASRRYCMRFGGTSQFAAGKSFRAVNADAPGTCAP